VAEFKRIDGGRDRPYETALPLSQDLGLVINSMIGRDDGMTTPLASSIHRFKLGEVHTSEKGADSY
jgi:hypothetical protein